MLYCHDRDGGLTANDVHQRTKSNSEPIEELEEVNLDDARPERTTRIGTLASWPVRQALTTFLKANQDVFTWSHKDMPGINPSIMVHKLNMSSLIPLVRQKKQVFA